MVDEALRLARSVNRHKAGLDSDLPKLLELLPELRAATGKGPKQLEALLEGAVERGTISRRTAATAGTSRKAADA